MFLRCAVVRRDQDQPAVRAVQVGYPAGGDRVHGGRNDDVCGTAGRRQPDTLTFVLKTCACSFADFSVDDYGLTQAVKPAVTGVLSPTWSSVGAGTSRAGRSQLVSRLLILT